MKKLKFKQFSLILILALTGFIQSCVDSSMGHYLTNESFILLKDSVSPNGQFEYYEYQFDNGGLGYSRVFWAVINKTDEDLNLKKFNLPDGYRIIGWSSVNELEIEEWKPYYYKDEEVKLKDGSFFNNVKLKIEN